MFLTMIQPVGCFIHKMSSLCIWTVNLLHKLIFIIFQILAKSGRFNAKLTLMFSLLISSTVVASIVEMRAKEYEKLMFNTKILIWFLGTKRSLLLLNNPFLYDSSRFRLELIFTTSWFLEPNRYVLYSEFWLKPSEDTDEPESDLESDAISFYLSFCTSIFLIVESTVLYILILINKFDNFIFGIKLNVLCILLSHVRRPKMD